VGRVLIDTDSPHHVENDNFAKPIGAAQSSAEVRDFVEAFARVTVLHIRDRLIELSIADHGTISGPKVDWEDPVKLALSGIDASNVDSVAVAGQKYLHIDAAFNGGAKYRREFLDLTGLSDKQIRLLFPGLKAVRIKDPEAFAEEVRRLNSWLDEIRRDNFDPKSFRRYQEIIGIHGAGQNLSGRVGAAGAAIAFVDAISEINSSALADSVGELTPPNIRSPTEVYEWLNGGENRVIKTLLLSNGRAIVFASSKDANIFQSLNSPFASAQDALEQFNAVQNDRRERSQKLHEFAVGEVKTATDPANLHERMGLASRETQTELRTDRFLMMALLNPDILSGGQQGRTLNNRDLTRFTQVFNLHHCWGWDGGRSRNPGHWNYFLRCVKEWCGL